MVNIDASSFDYGYKSKETDCNNYNQYSYSEHKGVDLKQISVWDYANFANYANAAQGCSTLK